MVFYFIGLNAVVHSSSLSLSFVLLERLTLLLLCGKIGTFISHNLLAASVFTIIIFESSFVICSLLFVGRLDGQTGKFKEAKICISDLPIFYILDCIIIRCYNPALAEYFNSIRLLLTCANALLACAFCLALYAYRRKANALVAQRSQRDVSTWNTITNRVNTKTFIFPRF